MGRTLAEIQAKWDQDREDAGWRVVEDFPLYEISMYGTIRNIESKKEVKQTTNRAGKTVRLATEGKSGNTQAYVKSLVLKAYPHRDYIEPDPPAEVKTTPKPKPKPAPKPVKVIKPKPTILESLEGEEWRPIPDFPLYELSSLKRVRNVETGHIQYIAPVGTVNLRRDGRQNSRSVTKLHSTVFADLHVIEGEEWKPVPEFHEYEVSNQGRVRNIQRQAFMPIRKNMVNFTRNRVTFKRNYSRLLRDVWGIDVALEVKNK